MTPNDNPDMPNIQQAQHELREGIENSRHLLRQSRVLIELSECDGASARDGDDYPVAN